jgi:dynein heavy chain
MMPMIVFVLQILEAVQPAAARQGLESPVQLWGYFVSQCKRHLHVVLCMSPIGNAFRWAAVGGWASSFC